MELRNEGPNKKRLLSMVERSKFGVWWLLKRDFKEETTNYVGEDTFENDK